MDTGWSDGTRENIMPPAAYSWRQRNKNMTEKLKMLNSVKGLTVLMQISAIHVHECKTEQRTPSMTRPSPKPAASEYDSRSMLFSASGPGGRPEHFKHHRYHQRHRHHHQ